MAKAVKKQALGRGLSALLKDPNNDIQSISDKNAEKVIGNVIELELDSIEVNPFQPRQNFDDQALEELASSIRELGIIQPITVRKVGFDSYQLVSGERRYRASRLVGLETIPAYIRIANDQESLEMALVENIQRQDLDPIEIALSYQRLIEEIELTQEKLSSRVGKKRSTITNYLRLLKLPAPIQTAMKEGDLSMGHGRSLVSVEDQKNQLRVFQDIMNKGLSVRATEDLVRKLTRSNGRPERKTTDLPVEIHTSYAQGVERISEALNIPVTFKASSKGVGNIQITVRSEEEFARIKKLLTGE